MASKPESYEHTGFLGLRNNVPAERFGSFEDGLKDLEAATNVDIDDSRRATRRKGYSAAVVAGATKSLWASGPIALAVKSDTSLVQIHPSYATTTLRTGLTPGLPMSYTLVGDRVFYSNGVETGVVRNGASRTWGLEIPSGQPVAEAIGGTLPAGRYQYAVTFLRSDGQESGTRLAASIDLSIAGGIRLSAIPSSDDPDVSLKAIYLTTCNGADLYRVGLIDADETGFDYQSEASMQVPLKTQHLRPAPPGHLVDNFNGRTLVASGNVLRYSEPYAHELFDLRKGYPFMGQPTLLAALDSGVYVGTHDAVVWLDGAKPEEWTMRPLMSYGAIPGASATCTRDMIEGGGNAKRVVLFATTQGICLGEDGGQVSNLTQDRFAYPIQERGAAVIRRHRGFIQAVITMQGTERTANTAS